MLWSSFFETNCKGKQLERVLKDDGKYQNPKAYWNNKLCIPKTQEKKIKKQENIVRKCF